MKKLAFAAVAALAIGTASAEMQLGVEVYPGAKPAPEVVKFFKETLKMTGHAYETSDSLDKVVAFYKKQPGLTLNPNPDSTQAGFAGKGVTITVQNPWADMQSGKVMKSTLVSIMKSK